MRGMPVELSGGCLVNALREGAASVRGGVRAWNHVGRATGAAAISLRVLEVAEGRSELGGAPCDEVLYVFDGEGALFLDGGMHRLVPDTGFYVPPGARFQVECAAPLTLVSSRCPDPGEATEASTAGESKVVRLEDCLSETTGDRWYRVLLDHHIGNSRVTQFVGAIPPGRAPDHYHEYEEVLCILAGRGRMWAGDRSTPIERGACIYLPRRQMHCVENTGDGELRLLGVFHPSGSPAVRYGDRRT
jgi:mannose-6-phosphate isomerase-like protein (cupin superfamily)